jgi:hypothetical protein
VITISLFIGSNLSLFFVHFVVQREEEIRFLWEIPRKIFSSQIRARLARGFFNKTIFSEVIESKSKRKDGSKNDYRKQCFTSTLDGLLFMPSQIFRNLPKYYIECTSLFCLSKDTSF